MFLFTTIAKTTFEISKQNKMRYLTLNINSNTCITIDNDFSGKESVYYNGELKSSHRSFFGSRHAFSVEELGMSVTYTIDIRLNMFTGIGFAVKRNDHIVMTNLVGYNHGESISGWSTFIAIISLFIGGFMVGYGLMKQEYPLAIAGLFLAGGSQAYKYIKTKILNKQVNKLNE